MVIYATGGGVLKSSNGGTLPLAPQTGSVTLGEQQPTYAPIVPVSVTIGGQAAQINYVRCAPYEIVGMLQINAVVPQGIGSGAQPVVLKIGNNDNSAQQVTVAVK